MMIRFVRRAATLALLLHVSTVGPALAQQAEFAAPQPLATAENINFAILGTKPVKPAPTLFIFALDAQRTLTSETYRQAGNILSQRGYLCVSLDLPCHGSQCRQGEATELKGWRQRIDAGENIMDEFTERASKVLDYLIEERYADPDRVAACGTSRGGFSACHFAIADPRVKCVAAYIPVADLAAITEFHGSSSVELLDSLSLIRNAGKLADRGVWISIGDRDQRVNTDRSIAFARALSAAGSKRGPRNIELHVSSIEGHATPRNAAEQSAAWIDATLKTK
jgi:dienelactone hydrolase